jgi:glycerophosphoryl diester phosphodiesterase
MGRLARFLLLFIVGMIAVFLFLAWSSRPVPEHLFFVDQPDTLVIAHQGGDGLWPSNTLYAFERATALGADVLEMDVHSTADGVIVLSHDETVDRLTDGSGLIKEMTLEQLKELDAGYDWNKDDSTSFPYRGQGITIPTLEEVLTAFPDMRMNIEIKQREPSIVASFCNLLRRHDRERRVLVASFHPDTIEAFRQTCPEMATAATEPEIRPFFVLNRIFLDAVYRPPAEAFQVPEYSGNLHVLTPRFVRGAHNHNINVHVWTVNETEDMRRLLELGVDGIITDRPDRLLTLLAGSN